MVDAAIVESAPGETDPSPCAWPGPLAEAEFQSASVPAVIVARDCPRWARDAGYTIGEADAFRAGMEAAAKVCECVGSKPPGGSPEDCARAIRADAKDRRL